MTNVEAVSYQNLSAQSQMPASILDKNNCWSLKITAESADAVYYVRAYATVGGNITYGDVKEVKLSSLKSGLMMVANLEAFEEGLDEPLTEVQNSILILDETTDNSEVLTEWNGDEATVTLQRTLQTGGWNTFAAPFAIDDPASIGISAVKELQSATMENNTLMLNFDNASSIEAGKPYLVKVTDAVVNPTFAGVIVSKEAAPFTSQYVDFIPTLGKTTITGDDAKTVLFIAADNKLKNPTELPADMKGFRAYFQLKGEAATARSFSLNFGDETTGIQIVETESQPTGQKSQAYDLQGRRVNGAAQKGVYVVNGKKVIIK